MAMFGQPKLPPVRSLWRYVGPGPCHGRIHMVLYTDVLEVVSMCAGDGHFGQGYDYSWLGSVADFLTNFRFAAGPIIGIIRK